VCECDPEKDDPCGKDADCINRMLMLECSPTMCRAKDRCGNMQFQRRVYPAMSVRRTASRGWGLFINQVPILPKVTNIGLQILEPIFLKNTRLWSKNMTGFIFLQICKKLYTYF
jgi:hypothetical protein